MDARTAPADAVDLSQIIERQRFSGFILRLVAVSVVVTLFDGYDMQGIAYVAPYLQTAFHLDKLMLGNLFSAGIVGNVIGGFAVGWCGDRFGRRPAIIGSTAAFGVLTCCLALARSYDQFMVLRFLDGIVIGGMLPVCWALNIEYAPKRFRATIVTVVMMGYTIGSSAAGPIAIWFIPRFGWPSAFLFGGVGSLLAAVLLYFTLPESIRFLCSRGRRRDVIARTVKRLAPDRAIGPETRFILSDEAVGERGQFDLSPLFEGELRWITPLIWIAYTVSSVGVYFSASWGPIVFENLGFTRSTAAWAASVNALGGMLGGLALMRFTDRYGTISISVLPALVIPVLLVCGLVPLAQTPFLILVFVSTLLLVGAQFGVISIAGIFYPSAHRSTGAGWASTVAKIGSIAGPIAGGIILSSHLPVRNVYAILAVCPFVMALCLLALGLLHRSIIRRDTVPSAWP